MIYTTELDQNSIPARNEMMTNGVIVRRIGACLAACHPLVITDDAGDQVFDVMAEVLR